MEPAEGLRLTVLIPVKDEEENIPILAAQINEALGGLDLSWEVLWVDDGSTDGSFGCLETLARFDGRHRYLRLTRNYGQSAALLTGFREARGAVIATLDADLQNDPFDIPRLLSELDAAAVDMVNGVRMRRRDRWVRRASSWFANGFRNRMTGEEITDVGCSMRVVRRQFVQDLPAFRGMHRFLPTLARLRGASLREVPVRHHPRQYGRTKYGIHDRLWVGLLDTLGVCWLKARWVSPAVSCRGGGATANPLRASMDADHAHGEMGVTR